MASRLDELSNYLEVCASFRFLSACIHNTLLALSSTCNSLDACLSARVLTTLCVLTALLALASVMLFRSTTNSCSQQTQLRPMSHSLSRPPQSCLFQEAVNLNPLWSVSSQLLTAQAVCTTYPLSNSQSHDSYIPPV